MVPYGEALRWQERLVDERLGGGPDRLLLVTHPPVVTCGRNADRAHLVASPALLAARGVEVFDTPRGGDVTFHGPGQVVAYPIVGLPPAGRNVRGYVTDVEEVVIRTLRVYDVEAQRVEGLRGVWVGRQKVAAVGIRLWRWVTSHGFALNVCPDLSYFDLIVPCGIVDRGVTSLARLLARPPTVAEVEDVVVDVFSQVFGYTDVRDECARDR